MQNNESGAPNIPAIFELQNVAFEETDFLMEFRLVTKLELESFQIEIASVIGALTLIEDSSNIDIFKGV